MTHPDLTALAAELRKLQDKAEHKSCGGKISQQVYGEPNSCDVCDVFVANDEAAFQIFLRNNAATLATALERVAALEKEVERANAVANSCIESEQKILAIANGLRDQLDSALAARQSGMPEVVAAMIQRYATLIDACGCGNDEDDNDCCDGCMADRGAIADVRALYSPGGQGGGGGEMKCKYCGYGFNPYDANYEPYRAYADICVGCTKIIAAAAIRNGYAVENGVVTMKCENYCLIALEGKIFAGYIGERVYIDEDGYPHKCGSCNDGRIPASPAGEGERKGT